MVSAPDSRGSASISRTATSAATPTGSTSTTGSSSVGRKHRSLSHLNRLMPCARSGDRNEHGAGDHEPGHADVPGERYEYAERLAKDRGLLPARRTAPRKRTHRRRHVE